MEAKIVELSTEVVSKDYEIEFFSSSIIELEQELGLLKKSSIKPLDSSLKTPEASTVELDSWKKKCKIMQQQEI